MSSTWLTRRVRRSVSATTMARNCWRCAAVHVGVVAHQLGERADRGQRRAQLVRHRRHEVVLQPVEALQCSLAARSSARRAFERLRLLLQRVRVGAHLRGLVEDAHHVVERERAPPRPPRPPSARAEALPIAPASCVSTNCTSCASGAICSMPRARRRAARSRRTARCAASRAEEAAGERQQVGHLRARRARTPARAAGRGRCARTHRRTAAPGSPRAPTARATATPPTYSPTLASRLQNSEWVRPSSPVRPNNCSGLSKAMPNGPWRRKPSDSQPDLAIDGSISV